MEPAWRQQGRGRGRSQEAQGERSRPPQQKEKERPGGAAAGPWGAGRGGRTKTAAAPEPQRGEDGRSKFEEIRKSNQAAAQRLVESQISSSSDDDDDNDDDGAVDHEDGKRGKILASTFTTYTNQTGGDVTGLVRTGQYVSDLFQSGALTCLICIASVKRTQAVWSCSSCFSLFHLPCIQKWAKDSAFLVSSVTDEDFGQKQHPWPCPKCRAEYPPSATPNRYMCYCGKMQDPPADPWLAPHSCGSVCQKELKPTCGHTCLLLCHPGPCPPCPKMVSVSCMCGKAKPLPRRCSNKAWSCQQQCNKLLPCRQHTCTQPCHTGTHSHTCTQPCHTGTHTHTPVHSPVTQVHTHTPVHSPVTQVHTHTHLYTALSHRYTHTCTQPCHTGTHTPVHSPVTQVHTLTHLYTALSHRYTLTHLYTVLSHRYTHTHTCTQPCHTGTHTHTCTQPCHTGTHTHTPVHSPVTQVHTHTPVHSPVTQVHTHTHTCTQPCHTGTHSHTCTQPCHTGRHTHTCTQSCHTGSCYPCPETVEVRCTCGSSVLVVPCGRERSTKPPRCKESCRCPSSCHHPTRETHRCHPGPCPPCRQSCLLPLPGCSHTCPQPCHDLVLVKSQQLAGPWEQPSEPAFVKKALPCPPCQVAIPTSCFGEHEVSPVPCHRRGRFSCKRPCGRPLTCGNHDCSRECHLVTNGNKCEVCEEACSKPRPPGCPHTCPRPCHPGDCPPCSQMIRQRCHCKISLLYIECTSVHSRSLQERVV
uniref:Nuclear transcription factor, X-box binding-like 1 n=1 Tax=Sparus aurata TaxID=8175 RepID=A0A671W7Z7_SPAAU